MLSGMFDPDANIVFGATVDEAYGDEKKTARRHRASSPNPICGEKRVGKIEIQN